MVHSQIIRASLIADLQALGHSQRAAAHAANVALAHARHYADATLGDAANGSNLGSLTRAEIWQGHAVDFAREFLDLATGLSLYDALDAAFTVIDDISDRERAAATPECYPLDNPGPLGHFAMRFHAAVKERMTVGEDTTTLALYRAGLTGLARLV